MPGATDGKSFCLLAHCTERTNAPETVKHWVEIFERLGVDLVVAAVGCCGMSGTFGHEASNRAISEKLYAMSWKPVIEHAAARVRIHNQ